MRKEIREFLAFLKYEKNASPNTIASYGRDLVQLAAYLEERKVELRRVDNIVLRGFLGRLHEKRQKKTTIGRKLAAVRSFFQFCLKKRWLLDNPAKVVSTPKQDKNVPSFLSEAEMASFLELPRSDRPLDLRDKAARETHRRDHWSPNPMTHKQGDPWPSLFCSREVDPKALRYARKIWKEQGYEGE